MMKGKEENKQKSNLSTNKTDIYSLNTQSLKKLEPCVSLPYAKLITKIQQIKQKLVVGSQKRSYLIQKIFSKLNKTLVFLNFQNQNLGESYFVILDIVTTYFLRFKNLVSQSPIPLHFSFAPIFDDTINYLTNQKVFLKPSQQQKITFKLDQFIKTKSIKEVKKQICIGCQENLIISVQFFFDNLEHKPHCFLSNQNFLENFLGSGRMLNILERICCLLNVGGGYIVIGLNQKNLSDSEVQMIYKKMKYIFRERLYPNYTAKYQLNSLKITGDISTFLSQKKIKLQYYHHNEQFLQVQTIFVLNVYPEFTKDNLSLFYGIKQKNYQKAQDYSVYVPNLKGQIVILKTSAHYQLMHQFYRLYRANFQQNTANQLFEYCKNGVCRYGTIKLLHKFKMIFLKEFQSNIIEDIHPSDKYSYSNVVGLPHNKASVKLQVQNLLKQKKIKGTLCKPFQRQTLDIQRQLYFLNSNAQHTQLNKILKDKNYLSYNTFLIVITKFLRVDTRLYYQGSSGLLKKLTMSLRKKFHDCPRKVIPDQAPNFFQLTLSFNRQIQCYYAFSLLQNQHVQSKFISNLTFDTLLANWENNGKVKKEQNFQ